MKAYVCTGYGPAGKVLQLADIPAPQPKADELQIRIRAVSVNSGDSRLRRADPFFVRFVFGLTKPNPSILGIVMAGEVSAVGAEVEGYRVGDAVFGMTGFKQLGTFAEYCCVSARGAFARKPANLDFAEAAALPFGGHTALDFLRKADLKAGEHILVYGASGAVGAAVVQLAKHYGAAVTAVCGAANVELVRSLGADTVIDYTKTPLAELPAGRYDVVFDTVGVHDVSDLARLTADGGRLVLCAMLGRQALQSLWLKLRGTNKKVVSGNVSVTAEDMDFLRRLAEEGRFRPVVDHIYPFSDMVAAHERVDTGRKRGNVVVAV